MPELNPTEHTVDELRDQLADVDDPAELRDAYETEESNDDRSSAKEAIRKRLDEVAESEPEPQTDGSGEVEEKSDEGSDGESSSDSSDEEDEGESDSASETGGESRNTDVMAVKESVQDVATELIGYELSGVTEIRRVDDGWEAVVEVVERPSVPDTQDILGAYEIRLDKDGTVTGYRRVDRYRRADTNREEHA